MRSVVAVTDARPPAHAANQAAAAPSSAAAPAVKARMTALLRAREIFSFARRTTSSTRRSASGWARPVLAAVRGTILRLHAAMTRGGQQDAGRLCARIIEIGIGTALSAEQPVEIVGDEVFTANVAQDEELNRAGDNLSVVHLKRLTARAGRGVYDRASVNHSFNLSFTVRSGTTRMRHRTMAEFASAQSGIHATPQMSSRWIAGPSHQSWRSQKRMEPWERGLPRGLSVLLGHRMSCPPSNRGDHSVTRWRTPYS
jgi:hypothetical protein